MAQQTINPDETILTEASDGTKLVVYRDIDEVDVGDRSGEITIYLPDLDHAEGAIRFVDEDPVDGTTSTRDVEYQFREARLAYGLWLRCGPFHQPEGRAIPYSIATDGQDAITAYVHLGNGSPLSRAATASICGVEEQTVSDRLSRIRWRPDRAELEEPPSSRMTFEGIVVNSPDPLVVDDGSEQRTIDDVVENHGLEIGEAVRVEPDGIRILDYNPVSTATISKTDQ